MGKIKCANCINLAGLEQSAGVGAGATVVWCLAARRFAPGCIYTEHKCHKYMFYD